MQDYLNFHIDFNNPDVVLVYDELPLWSAMFGLLLLRHLPLRPKMRVLDAGCGTGFPLLELSQRLGPDSTICGIDPWQEALDRLRIKMKIYGVKNVELTVGSAASMPFPDGEFDLIVSNLGINNFENPEAVFAECYRVTKPSGLIALTTNLVGHMKEFYDVFESTLRQAKKNKALGALEKHIHHRATIEKVQTLFSRSGFRLTRVHQDAGKMRFANGTALLNHYFIKLGFLDGWKGVLLPEEQPSIFRLLEENLNQLAATQNGLDLTIPQAYIEGIRVP